MDEQQLHEFIDVLNAFDYAMLVTRRGSELRSRPMGIADRTDDGHVWFITSIDSAKLDEITENPAVNVAMQADDKFLSISGTVRATRDPERISAVWDGIQDLWFPKGRHDPTLVLLEVVPTYAEYWDRSGIESVRFAFDAAKAMVTGETLQKEAGKHGKLDFPKTRA
ncbi:MAG TPA: pyridoxamine 5'-phosphate oxidase family protein [Woeseiaceae bacterium]|nr:pyridoxamine 5'-phosphate oxidase family protein [Woeseiaceae bacterium]